MASWPLVRFVYLAEPVDQVSSLSTHWPLREDAVKMLNAMGVGVYQPSRAFRINSALLEPGPEVTTINDHALSHCDATLAFLPYGQATVGVPMEIDRSVQSGKPTAVVTDNDRSWSLCSSSPNLRCFLSHQDAVQWLLSRRTGPTLPAERDGVPLPFLRVGSNDGHVAALPSRGFADDAGLDLYVSEDTKIDPGTFVDIPTSVACGFPPGVWGLIIGRSSTLRQRGLMVNQGVIDPGYRGPLFAGAWNLTKYPVRVKTGDRIAQMILLPSLSSYSPHWADKLPESHDGRGGAGFGSTG